MYWTLELASKLDDAPWPATKDELIDYAQRTCAPMEVIENLQEIEDDEMIYDNIEEIWPDYPSKEDFFFNEEEYWSHLSLFIKFIALLYRDYSTEKGFLWILSDLNVYYVTFVSALSL